MATTTENANNTNTATTNGYSVIVSAETMKDNYETVKTVSGGILSTVKDLISVYIKAEADRKSKVETAEAVAKAAEADARKAEAEAKIAEAEARKVEAEANKISNEIELARLQKPEGVIDKRR